jgi:3-methylfumaryl-CoA hydratase
VDETVERTEMLLPGPAQALAALLGVPLPDLEHGAGLPLLWHWVYLLDHPAQADLGPDGHPVRGTFPTPPGPGLRRMWAGGRVRTSGPLRCGALATKRSRVLSRQDKQGRSGPLTFAVAEHQIWQDGRVVVDEQQDIVYRPAVTPTGPVAGDAASPDEGEGPVVPPAAGEWAIDVSPTLLFRFSALTYNAHRIHYDRDFTRDVEGYPGLLTHGPLQALAMAEAARAAGCDGDLSLEYRLISPLFDFQGLVVRATRAPDSTATAARDIYGRRTATGTLTAEAGAGS